MVCGTSPNSLGLTFWKKKFPALEVNFLKKLPQLADFQIFQSSYINHGKSLSDANLAAKILAIKFGFEPDC